jgi:hypothetical protein
MSAQVHYRGSINAPFTAAIQAGTPRIPVEGNIQGAALQPQTCDQCVAQVGSQQPDMQTRIYTNMFISNWSRNHYDPAIKRVSYVNKAAGGQLLPTDSISSKPTSQDTSPATISDRYALCQDACELEGRGEAHHHSDALHPAAPGHDTQSHHNRKPGQALDRDLLQLESKPPSTKAIKHQRGNNEGEEDSHPLRQQYTRYVSSQTQATETAIRRLPMHA